MATGSVRSGQMSPIIVSSEDDNSSSEEESVTGAQLVARITSAWQNEKLSPELLVPLTDEIDALRTELIGMEGNMRKLEPTDIRLSIHRMEIKRLRYILTSYLRVRILKIQEYPWFYAKRLENRRSNQPESLMETEIVFLKEYMGNLELHLFNVGIEHMPIKYRRMIRKEQLIKPPNFNKFIFLLSHMDATIWVEDADAEREDVTLKRGCQYVMCYQPIRKYLLNGEVSLL